MPQRQHQTYSRDLQNTLSMFASRLHAIHSASTPFSMVYQAGILRGIADQAIYCDVDTIGAYLTLCRIADRVFARVLAAFYNCPNV